MPEMTEESYTALLEEFKSYREATDKKMAEMVNKMNDMTNLFKANVKVNSVSTNTKNTNEDRKTYLEKKLKASVK